MRITSEAMINRGRIEVVGSSIERIPKLVMAVV
jgi:hypothetical protein